MLLNAHLEASSEQIGYSLKWHLLQMPQTWTAYERVAVPNI